MRRRRKGLKEFVPISTEVAAYKALVLLIILIGLSGVLIFRLYQLQVKQKDHFIQLSEKNYVRTVYLDAPRGTIYDRNGIILAEDVPSFHAYIAYQKWIQGADSEAAAQAENDSIDLISQIFSIKQDLIRKTITESQTNQTDVIVKTNLNDREYALFNENASLLTGFYVKRGFKRHYPRGSTLSHVLGYTQLLDKESDQTIFAQNPTLHFNDRVGKQGVERYYESILQGEKGTILQKIDALGTVLEEKETKPIQKGNDIYLTIDIVLQEKVESLIKDHVSTMIILNCRSGEILACANNPGFDPNIFSEPIPDKLWNDLSSKRAFFNIAIQGEYPPGSIFKPLVSLFGLEKGYVSTLQKLYCGGKIDLEGLTGKYQCWVYPSQHGWITMKEALKYSCDIYFFELARKFKIHQFLDFAQQYGGISNRTGIDIPYEEPGELGNPDWKKKNVGYEWFEGDSMNLGIGQGYLTVTPIQMVTLYANIASNGKTPNPHFLFDTKAGKSPSFQVKHTNKTSIKQEYYEYIHQALHEVTLPGGTAPLLSNPRVPIAAKTGTAEDDPDDTGKPTQDLWLAGFAPSDIPEIAAVVMFEKSRLEFGGDLSPVFKEAILFYFQNKKQHQE